MAVILLKKKELAKLQKKHGLTNTEIAKKMDISVVQFWRVRNDHSLPGHEFIAGALATFPEAKFEDLFKTFPDCIRVIRSDF